MNVVQLERSLQTVRDQIAPDASADELAFFARVCAQLDLSPFAGQIVLIGRWDSRARRKVHRHQITVMGRRALAARTGELAGIEGPEWCGPRDAHGELHWSELWTHDQDPPYCARVFVYRKGWTKPANGTAKWVEFVQTNNQGELLETWKQMPSHMLGKVAESMALRRAFPDVITDDAIGAYVGETADDYGEVHDVPGAWEDAPAADVPDVDPLPEQLADHVTAGTDTAETDGPVASHDHDWWAARAEQAEIPIGRLLAQARRLAAKLGLDAPRSVDEIRDARLVNAVLDWLDQIGPAS